MDRIACAGLGVEGPSALRVNWCVSRCMFKPHEELLLRQILFVLSLVCCQHFQLRDALFSCQILEARHAQSCSFGYKHTSLGFRGFGVWVYSWGRAGNLENSMTTLNTSKMLWNPTVGGY